MITKSRAYILLTENQPLHILINSNIKLIIATNNIAMSCPLLNSIKAGIKKEHPHNIIVP